jgi:hypothetical protein
LKIVLCPIKFKVIAFEQYLRQFCHSLLNVQLLTVRLSTKQDIARRAEYFEGLLSTTFAAMVARKINRLHATFNLLQVSQLKLCQGFLRGHSHIDVLEGATNNL